MQARGVAAGDPGPQRGGRDPGPGPAEARHHPRAVARSRFRGLVGPPGSMAGRRAVDSQRASRAARAGRPRGQCPGPASPFAARGPGPALLAGLLVGRDRRAPRSNHGRSGRAPEARLETPPRAPRNRWLNRSSLEHAMCALAARPVTRKVQLLPAVSAVERRHRRVSPGRPGRPGARPPRVSRASLGPDRRPAVVLRQRRSA